jgi:hypothetical protein
MAADNAIARQIDWNRNRGIGCARGIGGKGASPILMQRGGFVAASGRIVYVR